MTDARSQFLDYMAAQGVIPADPSELMPGVFCRFDLMDEPRGKKSGVALYHDDEFPNGIFGNLKIHNKNNLLKWSPKHQASAEWTDEQRKEYAKVQAERRAARKAAIASLQAEAAELCRRWWAEAKPASDSHPYLERKGVRAHGLRESRGSLLVPVIIDGALSSLQFIDQYGVKKFKKGGAIAGGYSLIGPKPTDRLVICEGWATGASIHEATQLPVIPAFDAGNLAAVAGAMRLKFPEAEILIACDDDRWTAGNPGLTAGMAAAQACGGVLRRPVFKSDDGKPTDLNDLASQCGLAEVRAQLMTGHPTFQPLELPPAVRQRSESGLLEPFPHITGKGKPKATIENVVELLDRMAVNVRYNVIKKTSEILIPDTSNTVDNAENAAFARIQSWCNFAGLPTGNLEGFITTVADQNLYNPVATWVTSKPWDQTPRLQAFFDTVEAEDQPLKVILMRRWLISAIAAAFEPNGISAKGVLVFQGVQNVGKTSWFKRLAPPALKAISDGKTLRLDDKDSVFQVISNWIVELGELDATFKKSEIAHLKSFITKDQDVLRRPFDRKESHFARKTVFFASVNKREFLVDDTGNKRFWVIATSSINYRHDLDMQQVWAEVYETLYLKGESWHLTDTESALLDQANEDFSVQDPILERIASYYDWSVPATAYRKATAIEILKETGIDRPTQSELNKVSQAVQKLNGGQIIKRMTSGRFLLIPPRPLADLHPIFHGPP